MPESELSVDQLFQVLSDQYVLMLNADGIVLRCNQAAGSLMGLDSSDLVGKPFNETFAMLGVDRDFRFEVLKDHVTDFLTASVQTVSGNTISVKAKISNIELNTGENVYIILGSNLSESDQLEQKLYQVMEGTSKEVGFNFLDSVTKSLSNTLDTAYAFIGQLYTGSDGNPWVRSISFWKNNSHAKSLDYKLAGSPCERVVNKSQLLVSDKVQEKYPEDSGLVKLGVESYYGTPIFMSDGSPYGLLVVMDTKPMPPSASSAYILNIYANRIGSELDWLKSKSEIRRHEWRLNTIINNIPNPIYFKDKNGKYEWVNKAFKESLNLKPSKYVGRKIIGDPKEKVPRQEMLTDDHLLANKGTLKYEITYPTNEGLRNIIITKSSITSEEGEIEGVVGAATDVTHLKSAQKDLQLSEEKYRNLFSQANDAIFILDEYNFVDCNEKTLEIFECERDEIIGHPPYEFSPPFQPDGQPSKVKAIKMINAALRGENQSFYWKHLTKGGKEFDAEVSLNAYHFQDQLMIQAIVRDVSARVAQENSAKIQQERMERFYQCTNRSDSDFESKLKDLLAFATESLGMEMGLLSRIDANDYLMEEVFTIDGQDLKGTHLKTSETVCDICMEEGRLIAVSDITTSEYSNHPCVEATNIKSYIGSPYRVKGDKKGTIAFASSKETKHFSNIDRDFVELIAQWVGSSYGQQLYEESLLERDALLESLLRNIPVDFSVRDANLKMVWQSDRSKEIWGNNEGQDIDYSDVDPDSQKKWKKIFADALKGKSIETEDSPLIYGKPYDLFSIISPVFVRGEVAQVITINIDISQLKEAQNQLETRNFELQKLNEELDRFVYSASHDLRAPLASILGLISLSRTETSNDDKNKYLAMMEQSIRTMDEFISEITEYSRNLRLQTEISSIQFEDIINASFEHLKFMSSQKPKIKLDLNGTEGFSSDPDRIKLVFNNLFSNSIRYAKPGSDPEINIKVRVKDESATIEVSDNGIGIEPEHKDRVFDMFYRANDTNVGSGLGLFIVQETVQKLGGTISLESEPGKGTDVKIILPNHK